jgi:DNA-binding beta-propeller fold protein YncE
MRRACASFVFLCLIVSAAQAGGYRLAQELKIPGGEGWDYLTIDSAHDRLFVSHGSHVEVVDTKGLKLVGSIADTPGVHGVAIAPDLGRGYVSAGASSSVVVFDLETLARIAEIKTSGENPDAILYEPVTHRIFTFNGRGRNVSVIDAASNEVIGTIPLDAKPEFAVSDDAGHIYVNLEDRNSVAKIDATTLTLLATWPLTGCEEPSGLAIDREHHRLFSVCSNKTMAILDSLSGRQVVRLPVGANVDGAGFDDAAQLAFASGGDGTLTIVKEKAPDRFIVLQTVVTRLGARTMTVDSRTHDVYLSRAERGEIPAASETQPRPRAPVIPDTFEVLVVSSR